ncbi:MAG: cupredoxin domain-containing protein [SAR202 cluster bacterium]|nr:cupredoxin domain-containing protein [SAR202 cluster bacterium]
MRKFTTLSIIVTIVAIFAFVACGSDDSADDAPVVSSDSGSAQPASDSGSAAGDATRITVTNQDPGGSGDYKFDPNEFTFSVGEKVDFKILAESEFHTFTVDDLGIDVAIDAGDTETLTFTFDKAGEYELICIPHEALGMKGKITVE